MTVKLFVCLAWRCLLIQLNFVGVLGKNDVKYVIK
jgi:hypothetical protein